MKTQNLSFSLANVALLAALLPLNGLSQSTATPKKTTTTTTTPKKSATAHKPLAHKAATQSCDAPADAMTLPADIPAVTGNPQTIYALRYVDATVGTGAPALPGQYYTVHYTGWLHDGTKFDSSVDRGQPFEFLQGSHHVIAGWDEGFAGMKVGGKRRMLIPYQLAYGERGRPGIPPKADLIFDIELLNVRDANAPAVGAAPHP
jgi:peptidylprolyl isomerase